MEGLLATVLEGTVDRLKKAQPGEVVDVGRKIRIEAAREARLSAKERFLELAHQLNSQPDCSSIDLGKSIRQPGNLVVEIAGRVSELIENRFPQVVSRLEANSISSGASAER